ncbi:radical SAM protein [candidate division KSB1 bacterium]
MSDKRCTNCGEVYLEISGFLGVCLKCIRTDFDNVLPVIKSRHSESRKRFNLPEKPPKNSNGVLCRICGNKCQIGEGDTGYCGLRKNVNGRLSHLAGTKYKGLVYWYYDHLPTNCCADWVCAGCSSSGYPKYSYSKGAEYNRKNLAVFYKACTFNCLFCQNWDFRNKDKIPDYLTSDELAKAFDSDTSCICYFGGDPTPQLLHAISASKTVLAKNKGKIIRICWESNGNMNRNLLKVMAELSLESGGCIKFDLKSFNERINTALCGVSNKTTLENFKLLSKFFSLRPNLPLLIASTLLIPGYIDTEEISKISQFIANLNPEIPYKLLAFYPQFYFKDLPVTSTKLAYDSLNVAKDAGLKNVDIGNKHLLKNL